MKINKYKAAPHSPQILAEGEGRAGEPRFLGEVGWGAEALSEAGRILGVGCSFEWGERDVDERVAVLQSRSAHSQGRCGSGEPAGRGLEPLRGLRGAAPWCAGGRAGEQAAALPGSCGTRRSTASRCPGRAPSM